MNHFIILSRNAKSVFLYFLFFTSFFYQVQAQDILKVVPANSSGVLTMDGGYFLSKIDLAQILRLEMFQEMDERTQGRRGKSYNEYSKIYKAPETIGIKLNAKWYLFTDHSDTNEFGMKSTYTNLTLPLVSGKKFESFIKKVSDSTIRKNGNYKYAITGYNQLVAWNKSQAIVILASGYSPDIASMLKKELEYLTTIKPTETILSNKNFQLAQAQKFDFNYWMSFSSLFSGVGLFKYSQLIPAIKNLPYFQEDFYKDYYMHMNLNFNKGAVSFDARQFLTESSANTMSKYYGKGINTNLFNYIHKDHLLGMYSISTNMKEIKSTLDTSLHDTIKNKINLGFTELLYEKRFNQLPEVKRMKTSIDSMYTDLYKNYDDYSVDTAAAYIDTTSYDYNYATDSTSSIEYPEEPVDSVTYETTYEIADSIVVDTAAVYDYAYNNSDSLYNAKNEKIEIANKEKKSLKEKYMQQKLKGLDLKELELLDLFEGDFLIAITDLKYVPTKYKTYEYDEDEYKTVEVEKTKLSPFPDVLATLTLNNVPKAQSLLTKLTKDTFLIKEKNYYYSKLEDKKLFVAIVGKTLVITNDELLITKHLNGFTSQELLSKEIQGISLNKTFSAYANLKQIFAELQHEESTVKEKNIYTLLMNSFINSFANSGGFQNNINDSKFEINFTNKLDNSFYEILRIINESYKITSTR